MTEVPSGDRRSALDPPNTTDVDASLLGTLLGPYRLVRVLGRGGMGVVYEARHERTGGRRAVKMIVPERANQPNYRKRFHREAELAERVRHPGLVRVLDFAERPDGTPYLVMEYLEGTPLREVLASYDNGRVPLEQVVRWGMQLAAALSAAHSAKIAHLDIKPENILLLSDSASAQERCVKILDFGVARLVEESGSEVGPSRGELGTRAYMSPEQQLAGLGVVTSKSDVYSLGVVLYEMLSGQTPFASSTTESQAQYQRMLHQNLRPLHILRTEVPQRLDTLIRQMLDPRPFRRPSMREVATVLGAWPLPSHAHVGPRIALRSSMLLVLGIVLLSELYSFYLHHTLWWPGQHPESGMVRIPGGTFRMGSTAAEVEDTVRWAVTGHRCVGCERALYERELPSRTVALSSYFIDATEITNAQYVEFLNRQSNLTIEGSGPFVYQNEVLWLSLAREEEPEQRYVGISWETSRFVVRHGMERKPVVYVSFDGAQSYCLSRGMRLPTEAEWEYAARGAQRRRFPWGDDDPGCRDTVFARAKSGMLCSNESRGPSNVAMAVLDRTPSGVYDLGGNVSEWTLDAFRSRYPACSDDVCRDPVVRIYGKDPAEAGQRVVRGGSWYMEVDACRAATRGRRRPHEVLGDIGFRCVRPL